MADKNREQKKHYEEKLKTNREGEGTTFQGIAGFLNEKKLNSKNSTNEVTEEQKEEEEVVEKKSAAPRRSFWTAVCIKWSEIANQVIATLVAAAVIGLCGFFWWQHTSISGLTRDIGDLFGKIDELKGKYDKEGNFISVEVIKADLQSLKDRIRLIEARVFSSKP